VAFEREGVDGARLLRMTAAELAAIEQRWMQERGGGSGWGSGNPLVAAEADASTALKCHVLAQRDATAQEGSRAGEPAISPFFDVNRQ
jgi:hypothetical protein